MENFSQQDFFSQAEPGAMLKPLGAFRIFMLAFSHGPKGK